jgi:Tfp pilus assembly protein PilW
MTISTPPTKPRRPRSAALRAFTLTELMVAATLSLLVLTGVLSAFLMIGRSGFLASSYSELERETRRGLEIFGGDARKAVDLHWNSSQSVTLTLPTATNATTLVTYAYEADSPGAATGTFYRLVGNVDSTNPRLVLVHRVAEDFAFQRFKLEQSGVENNAAANDLETKQIQIALRASRVGVTTVAANQSALSACYILRNKRVSN